MYLYHKLSTSWYDNLGCYFLVLSGADPELLLVWGANPQRGRQPNILVIFSEKRYEIKEILVRREAPP